MATPAELYEFDLRGYIVIKGVLSKEEVDEINCLCDEAIGQENRQQRTGKFSFFELNPPYFLNLMAHPRTLGLLQGFMGDWFRFDHAFGVEMTRPSEAFQGLHAGPQGEQRVFFYQWAMDQMRNGLVKVVYALSDAGPGDGGFVVVAGSHKQNLPLPPLDLYESPLVEQPVLKAGDMLIFTEALVHGARRWQGEQPRRILIYSYAPGYGAWMSYEWCRQYLEFAQNDLQRQLLRPPFVGEFNDEAPKLLRHWPSNRYRQENKFPYDEAPHRESIQRSRQQVKDSLHHIKVASLELGTSLQSLGWSWWKQWQDQRR